MCLSAFKINFQVASIEDARTVQQAATYLENQVFTASPHRLHLMVIDATLRHARRGLESLEVKAWEAMFQSLSKARDCVSELIGGLQPDIAPELVDPTKDLFIFVYRNLAKADFDRDAQLIRDAISILEIHREAWVELGLQLGAAQPAGVAARPAYEDAPTTGRSWST